MSIWRGFRGAVQRPKQEASTDDETDQVVNEFNFKNVTV